MLFKPDLVHQPSRLWSDTLQGRPLLWRSLFKVLLDLLLQLQFSWSKVNMKLGGRGLSLSLLRTIYQSLDSSQAHYPASCSHMSQWMDDGGFYEGMTVEAQSKHLAKLISKRCPSCQAQIEKNEGCLQWVCFFSTFLYRGKNI